MQCSSCGKDLDAVGFPGGTIRCAACGVDTLIPLGREASVATSPFREPSPVAEQDTRNRCVRCKAVLDVRHQLGFVVAACPAGHGVFVKHSVLREIEIKHRLKIEVPNHDAGPLRCPRCDVPMERGPVHDAPANVIVDVCAEHGTWFDDGELKASLERKDDGVRHATAKLSVALAYEGAREEKETRDTISLISFLVRGFW